MIFVDVAAWAATAAILGSYLYAVRRPSRLYWFHRANAIGCLAIGTSAIAHHAYPSAAITAAFGLIGCYALWTERPM